MLEKFLSQVRDQIYANMKIKKGTKLSKKNIVTKRPSIGIGSEYFFKAYSTTSLPVNPVAP